MVNEVKDAGRTQTQYSITVKGATVPQYITKVSNKGYSIGCKSARRVWKTGAGAAKAYCMIANQIGMHNVENTLEIMMEYARAW